MEHLPFSINTYNPDTHCCICLNYYENSKITRIYETLSNNMRIDLKISELTQGQLFPIKSQICKACTNTLNLTYDFLNLMKQSHWKIKSFETAKAKAQSEQILARRIAREIVPVDIRTITNESKQEPVKQIVDVPPKKVKIVENVRIKLSTEISEKPVEIIEIDDDDDENGNGEEETTEWSCQSDVISFNSDDEDDGDLTPIQLNQPPIEEIIVKEDFKIEVDEYRITGLEVANCTSNERSKILNCNECHFETVYKHVMDMHRLIQHKITAVHCKLCKKGFATKEDFIVHVCRRRNYQMRTKNKDCPMCALKFSNVKQLETHMNVVHVDKAPQIYKFDCGICKMAFQKEQMLNHHLNKSHPLILI